MLIQQAQVLQRLALSPYRDWAFRPDWGPMTAAPTHNQYLDASNSMMVNNHHAVSGLPPQPGGTSYTKWSSRRNPVTEDASTQPWSAKPKETRFEGKTEVRRPCIICRYQRLRRV